MENLFNLLKLFLFYKYTQEIHKKKLILKHYIRNRISEHHCIPLIMVLRKLKNASKALCQTFHQPIYLRAAFCGNNNNALFYVIILHRFKSRSRVKVSRLFNKNNLRQISSSREK